MKSRRRHFNGLLTQWCPDYLIQRWKLFPTNFASKTWDDAQPTRRFIAWAGAALGFVALLLGSFGSSDPLDSEHPVRMLQRVSLVIWIVGPPLWFWYEFFYLYKRTKNSEDWDTFKHGQDQSTKIWIALAIVLLGLDFGKSFGTASHQLANATHTAVSQQA